MKKIKRIKRNKNVEDKRMDNLEKARKLRREMTERGEVLKQRNPMEVWEENKTSLRKSINAMCFDCNGGEHYRSRTKYCQIYDCPLWLVRPYAKGITQEDCENYVEREARRPEKEEETDEV